VGRTGWALTRGRAPQNGSTPLHCAAVGGHLEVVELLVAKKADTNAPDKVREDAGRDGGRTNSARVFRQGCVNRGCKRECLARRESGSVRGSLAWGVGLHQFAMQPQPCEAWTPGD